MIRKVLIIPRLQGVGVIGGRREVGLPLLHYHWGGTVAALDTERLRGSARLEECHWEGRQLGGRSWAEAHPAWRTEGPSRPIPTLERRGEGRSRMNCRSEATRRGSAVVRGGQEKCGG